MTLHNSCSGINHSAAAQWLAFSLILSLPSVAASSWMCWSFQGTQALCSPMAIGSLGHHAELMIKVVPGPCAMAAVLSGGEWSASANSCSTGGSSSYGCLPHFHQFLKRWGLSASNRSCLHLDTGTRSQELKSISWRLNLPLIFFVCIQWCIWIIEEKPKCFIKRWETNSPFPVHCYIQFLCVVWS